MSRNLSLLAAVVLLLGAPEITLAFSLKVDMGDVGQSVKSGWQEFSGDGKSLTRRVLSDYGNDVVNWDVNEPSPGLF